jgi:hypothetical protein
MPPGARVVGEPNDAAHGVMVVVAQRGAGTPVQDAIPEPPRVVGLEVPTLSWMTLGTSKRWLVVPAVSATRRSKGWRA